jgi:DNA-directed RNA polymerase subunit RPC12/RpoP
MSLDFDFEIDCPECNKEMTISSNQAVSTINCPYCNTEIELKDDGFSDGLRSAEKAIDDLFKGF